MLIHILNSKVDFEDLNVLLKSEKTDLNIF